MPEEEDEDRKVRSGDFECVFRRTLTRSDVLAGEGVRALFDLPVSVVFAAGSREEAAGSSVLDSSALFSDSGPEPSSSESLEDEDEDDALCFFRLFFLFFFTSSSSFFRFFFSFFAFLFLAFSHFFLYFSTCIWIHSSFIFGPVSGKSLVVMRDWKSLLMRAA